MTDSPVELREPAAGGEQVDRGRPPPWGWVVNLPEGDPLPHILPTWDYKTHVTVDCPCGAALDADGYMKHKSFDGRERYEQGGALRH